MKRECYCNEERRAAVCWVTWVRFHSCPTSSCLGSSSCSRRCPPVSAGRNAATKTITVKLLLYLHHQGSITFDGSDLHSIRLEVQHAVQLIALAAFLID